MELVFPRLTAYQQEVYDWLDDPYGTGKIAVLKAVRQCGKTFFIQIELLRMAFAHRCTSIVFEPTLPLARKVYKSIFKSLETTGLIKNANSQLLEIEFNNGSEILFKSTEQMNRGLTVTGFLVFDECAYLDDESIYSILPLVNAHNAPIIIASSPFTMDGYYYTMYLKGLENKPLIRTFDWSHHPEISRFLTPEQKELYRQTMSRAKYTTEIEGEFLKDGGLLFQGLENCIAEHPGDGPIVYVGIDFATGNDGDYTVLSVFDNHGDMVEIHRTNNLSPMEQINWMSALILDISSRKTIRNVIGEMNSIGSVYVDALKSTLRGKSIPITEWTTSNKSKQDLVTTMQIALENGYCRLLNEPNLLNEMRKYQAEINAKTKVVTYNGYKCHDDMVIATMLAYWAYKKGLGISRITLK